VRYHSGRARILMVIFESRHLTVPEGQFIWGGFLKSMGTPFGNNWVRVWLTPKLLSYMLEQPTRNNIKELQLSVTIFMFFQKSLN
jgi:hypothetical protein